MVTTQFTYQKTELQSFAIYLKGHRVAEQWLPSLVKNAKENNWQLETFQGINGLEKNLRDYGIKIDMRYKKSYNLMAKPGVQGCFLSHWHLWKKCIELNHPIGIFEFDVVFKKEPPSVMPADIIKLAGFKPAKLASTGQWWGGAYAYIISPQGAKKLLNWVEKFGASPADFMLADGIVDIVFDLDDRVELSTQGKSTTDDLKENY